MFNVLSPSRPPSLSSSLSLSPPPHPLSPVSRSSDSRSLQDMVEALQSPYHWLALRVCERGRLPYTCHLVRCPLSPCVLLAGVRKPHLSWILDVRVEHLSVAYGMC